MVDCAFFPSEQPREDYATAMKKVRCFEVIVGSVAVVFSVVAYLAAPGVSAFFGGLFATATWTAVVVETLATRR